MRWYDDNHRTRTLILVGVLVILLAILTTPLLAGWLGQEKTPSISVSTKQPIEHGEFGPAVVAEEVPTIPPSPDITRFGINIPKINVYAPVIADVDGTNEKTYQYVTSQLGLAHLKGTVRPTEIGNVYIFGHSSYYKTAPGKYKEVFRELNQVKQGETFTIFYQGKTYPYEVLESKVAEANDFSVLDPTPDDPTDKTITLQTSWPVGTAKQRYVVLGRQIK